MECLCSVKAGASQAGLDITPIIIVVVVLIIIIIIILIIIIIIIIIFIGHSSCLFKYIIGVCSCGNVFSYAIKIHDHLIIGLTLQKLI